MAHDVFISYSSKDKPSADGICANLEAAGLRCWIAPRDIRPGEEWASAIVNAISNSKVLLLVLSSHSNTSRQTKKEVDCAIHYDKTIIPFRIEAVEPSGSMKYYLGDLHWVDAFPPPLEEHIRKLSQHIHAVLTIPAAETGVQVQVPSPKPDSPRHNLPAQATSFFGRQVELDELARLLNDPAIRLVTILGAGGLGKTRLALEVGASQLDRYPSGVFFVPLAPLDSVESIMPVIAQATGFSFYEGGEPRQQLLDYFREKSMLLILDNFEHLLEGANLVTEILQAAPKVRILCTSRSRLNLQGEQLLRLGGMDFPGLESAGDALDYSAIQLFIQSARRLSPDLELTPGNIKAIAQICKLVEGVPLGILLAAAWVEMLSPEEIAEEIKKNMDFLETEQRDLPDRQKSMRAVFGYSWNLLSSNEQEVFRRLSVFRGGFTRAAAQQVGEASLGVLIALVDKSLVHRTPTGQFEIHELVRQFAGMKLRESGNESQIRTRHLDFFLHFSEEAEPKLRGPEQSEWLKRLELEHDNLRYALEWSLNEGFVERGLRMAYALLWFWDIRAHWNEGMGVTRKLLMQPGAIPRSLLRAKTLLTAAALSGNLQAKDLQQQWFEESISIARELGSAGHWILAMALGMEGFEIFNGDLVTAGTMIEESIVIARSTGDDWLVAFILAHAGYFAISKLDHSEAKARLEESLSLFQILGDKRWSAIVSSTIAHEDIRQGDFASARQRFQQVLPYLREEKDKDTIRWVLNALGVMEHAEGRYALAKGYYLEALEIARELGNGTFAPAGNLGNILLYEGDLVNAKSLFAENMVLTRRVGNKAFIAYTIQGYAALAAAQKKTRKGVMLLAMTRKLQEEAADKAVISPAGEADFARTHAILREQVDEASFNAHWEEGNALTMEQAIELALSEE